MVNEIFRKLSEPPDDKRAQQLEMQLAEDPSTIGRTGSDPTNSATNHLLDFGKTSRIVAGRIVDSLAYVNCYKVQVENGGSTTVAVRGCDVSNGAVGARDATTLLPGTRVWLIVHPQSYYAVIFLVEPDLAVDARQGLSDMIHQASRSGLHVDSCHSFPLQMDKGAGIGDWSAGRPFDQTTGGEWGKAFETGMGIHLDPFMFKLAVNENCGIFGSFWDSWLKLAAYTYQLRLAAKTIDASNDQGEFHYVEGSTPYPWEHMGAFDRSTQTHRTLSAQEAQIDKNWYSYCEPIHDDQQPFHRLTTFEGYLGQGFRRILAAPPKNASGLNRLGEPNQPVGLFSEHISLTGRYSLQSAKGITLLRRTRIPIPRQIREPQNTNGDNPENYQAAGAGVIRNSESLTEVDERGPHKITDGPAIPDDVDKPYLLRAAAIMDAHAHTFNWEANHAFHYHKQDWVLPEDAELEWLSQSAAIPDFSALSSKQYLPQPGSVTAKIDHRYGEATYYLCEQFLDFTDDGGVVLADGFGSEIRMVGGSIFLSCPGDIWMKPGKNANTWAGGDVVQRARNSVDISSAKKDVRIKAEVNLHTLSGNAGYGGTLIESRAESAEYDFENKSGEEVLSSGVMIRAPKSNIVNWGKDVYLRTGPGPDGDPEKFQAGSIIIDANRGRSDIVVHTNTIAKHFSDNGGEFHFFGTDGNIQTSNAFMRTGTAFGSQLQVDGDGSFNGRGYFNGWIYVSGGHVATELSSQYKGLVAVMSGNGLAELQSYFGEVQDNIATVLYDAGIQNYLQALEERWYAEDQAGNNTVMNLAEFGYRPSEQYRIDEFMLFEDRWQQLQRINNSESVSVIRGDNGMWKEPPVLVAGQESYPHPGKKYWVDEETYVEQDLNLYDAKTGTYKPRGERYESPEYSAPSETKVKLEGNYPVISKD